MGAARSPGCGKPVAWTGSVGGLALSCLVCLNFSSMTALQVVHSDPGGGMESGGTKADDIFYTEMCTEGAWGISAKDIRMAIGMDIVKRAVNCGFFFNSSEGPSQSLFISKFGSPFWVLGNIQTRRGLSQYVLCLRLKDVCPRHGSAVCGYWVPPKKKKK